MLQSICNLLWLNAFFRFSVYRGVINNAEASAALDKSTQDHQQLVRTHIHSHDVASKLNKIERAGLPTLGPPDLARGSSGEKLSDPHPPTINWVQSIIDDASIPFLQADKEFQRRMKVYFTYARTPDPHTFAHRVVKKCKYYILVA